MPVPENRAVVGRADVINRRDRSVARGHHNMDRVRDLADACLAVADLDPGVRDRGIAIVGFSLGGALALRLAAAPYLPRMVRAVVAVSATARSRGGGGSHGPSPEPPLRTVVACASAERDGAGLAAFIGVGARGRCAGTPYPGLRRCIYIEGRRLSRRGRLLCLLLAHPQHRCARRSNSPAARGRRSLGSAAAYRFTPSASRHRYTRRRPCRFSWNRKPTALVCAYCRRVGDVPGSVEKLK